MATTWKWTKFAKDELQCRHCKKIVVVEEFMDRLQSLRMEYGKPMIIVSGYRCPTHNQAVSSTGPNGPHTTGRAVDISVDGRDTYKLLDLVKKHGFTGIGIKQKGPMGTRFMHLDDLVIPNVRPNVWTY